MIKKGARSTLYLQPKTLDVLGGAENVSGRMNCIADRYNEIIQRQNIRDRFSDNQWAVVQNVVGAGHWEPAAVIVASLAQAFRSEHAARLMREQGVMRPQLLAALSDLSTAEMMAIIEMVEAHKAREKVQACKADESLANS